MNKNNGEEKAVVEKPKTFVEYLRRMSNELEVIVPSFVSVPRLIQLVLSKYGRDQKLQQCSHSSIAGCLMMMGQTGLEPVGGQCYILPFKEKGVYQAQFIIGYIGMIELFYRHDSSLAIYLETVKEGDAFEYELGSNPYIKHKPCENPGESKFHYSVAKLTNNATSIKVWTHQQCINHGLKYSKTVKNGKFEPWSTWVKDEDPMCRKTLLRQHSKVLPLSYETRKAIEADESVRNWLPGAKNFIELPNEAWAPLENGNQKSRFDEKPPPQVKGKQSEAASEPPSEKAIERLKEEGINIHGSEENFNNWLSFYTDGKILSVKNISTQRDYKKIWAGLRQYQNEQKEKNEQS